MGAFSDLRAGMKLAAKLHGEGQAPLGQAMLSRRDLRPTAVVQLLRSRIGKAAEDGGRPRELNLPSAKALGNFTRLGGGLG